ncbi:MAG TPA: MBL fold metallo-hydrolase [Bryobacteraceae bacterium]|jgi:glyoxylase-like metal-dependent hydrolase (beta-lactamase superfamily II)|nr:MBL fold metallo-hydrolase [Bryobacteraceae bacterium]
MELYKGAFQIQSDFGGRNLFQYLLAGDRLILLDSGIASTPEETILPYLDRTGIDPSRLSMLITTHPDMDHQGGNAAMRKAAPNALLACGEADRDLVSDPANLYARRYNYLRPKHGLGFEETPPPSAGSRCRVDVGFRGGEKIALSDGWDVEVLHVPGHSHGHLAVYDRAHKAAFVSDAVHGHGCPKRDGSMAFAVTYYYIDVYLSTLRYLEGLELDALYSGHWPNMHGEEIGDFFADSRRTVERLDRAILGALGRHRAGLTLKELLQEARNEFPEWPVDTLDLAMFAVKGHLERLEQSAAVRSDTGIPVRWMLP